MMQTKSPEELFPPCAAACPVGTDARRYVGLIFQGRYEEAMEVIKANNVIASVCAYICAHPCEDACRRQYVEGPLGIRALKRFVMDNTREYRRRLYQRAALTRPQRVAIVGSGPAGLAAARDLLLQGYPVTLFERESEPGGMPMNVVPKFRLPKAVVWEDLHELEALGAEFRTGQAWGKDFSLQDLKEQGYQAIMLAIGLQKGRSLPVPGMHAAGVHLALPFLRQVAQGQAPPLGEKVLIVGCGNVAMDAARAVKRLGAPEVLMICMEAPNQLFASPVETERTKDEVIDLIYQWAPKVVQAEGGRVQGIELMACTSLFDDLGRFAPTYDETRTQRLAADTVIFAIGQEAELDAALQEGAGIGGTRVAGGSANHGHLAPRGVRRRDLSGRGDLYRPHAGRCGRGQRPAGCGGGGPFFTHRPISDHVGRMSPAQPEAAGGTGIQNLPRALPPPQRAPGGGTAEGF